MSKAILFLIIIFLSFNVSAITLKENTVINQGNLNYIFEKSIEVNIFNLITDGVMIGDDKLIFIPEGGKVNIYFYDWGENKSIGIKSSVPQELIFKITVNNHKQYLYDNQTYHIDKVNIGVDLQKFTLEQFDDEITYIRKSVEKQDWYEKKILEFEYFKEKDEQGIIRNKTFSITYLGLILTIIGVIIIGGVIWKLN